MLDFLNQYSSAIQAISSIVMVFVTSTLVWLTKKYVKYTHEMVNEIRNQNTNTNIDTFFKDITKGYNTKQCQICGEKINSNAKKCHYCGEWIEKDKTINMV